MKALLIALALLCSTGCAVFRSPLFWQQTIGALLRAAYDNGGAAQVEETVDALEEDGKISAATAEALKKAAQKGFDKLLAALEDTGTNEASL